MENGWLCERFLGALLRMLGVLLICLLGISQASGQCVESAFPIRPVRFEVAGIGLEQYWAFSDPGGGELSTVAVDHAFWVADDAVLLSGHRPLGADGERLDPRAGLFLLQRSESYGMPAWHYSWACGLASDSLGEYRALVPITVLESGAYKLLIVDVQDETSIGIILVLFHDGVFTAERHLWLSALDRETGNSVGPCATLDDNGAVHFAADRVYALWSPSNETEAVYAGAELTWTLADGLIASPYIYTASAQRGVFYRLTSPGFVALRAGSRVPTGRQLPALAAEIAAKFGRHELRLFASEAALGAALIGNQEVRDTGYLGIWREGKFDVKWPLE